MGYFYGFDLQGNSYKVMELGNDIGSVVVNGKEFQAVRLAPSTYMDIRGRIYAANQNNCFSYSGSEWTNWARRKMYSMGIPPNF